MRNDRDRHLVCLALSSPESRTSLRSTSELNAMGSKEEAPMHGALPSHCLSGCLACGFRLVKDLFELEASLARWHRPLDHIPGTISDDGCTDRSKHRDASLSDI